MPTKLAVIPVERIENCIYLIRGQKVILANELAQLYDVSLKALNQAVKRNAERFPSDFMFHLKPQEFATLKSQFVTLDLHTPRATPYAFTEQGVAMLASVLHSHRAVNVSVEIMRAFVRLRQLLSSHADLAHKLEQLEQQYDEQFKIVFEAIRELMTPPDPAPKKIGFQIRERGGKYRVNGNGARS